MMLSAIGADYSVRKRNDVSMQGVNPTRLFARAKKLPAGDMFVADARFAEAEGVQGSRCGTTAIEKKHRCPDELQAW